MKKLAFIFVLSFVSNTFSQKESFIISSITKKLNDSRTQSNLNTFKNHNDLKSQYHLRYCQYQWSSLA
jgi:hypothetical protein